MWHYSDYIQVNRDFIDVYSAEADRQNAQAWKGFIPHRAMTDLLAGLIRSLERDDPRSLWIHGQYGTGKTFCQFVLKHMLEDPWAEVNDYLQLHGYGADTVKRLHAIRQQGDGLVVHTSGSAHLDSNRKFMAHM